MAAGNGGKFYLKIGGAIADVGEIKYGFVAPKKAYDDILGQVGVIKISAASSARGVAFGINSPKPPRIRITYKDTNLGGGTENDNLGSTIRFCDPDKLGQCLNGGLNNNKVVVRNTEYPIERVSMA